MKILFFAFLILSPLATQAASSPADSVHKCALFDYAQWRRDHPRPAGKQLANLNVGEPRTVRMIYFLPKDRPYRAEAVDTMKTRMRQAQDFFVKQMAAHGLGNTTFRFETDARGEPVVHRVDGRHSTRHYNADYTVSKVLDEVDRAFDIEANIYYIAIDNGNSGLGGVGAAGGVGGRTTKNGGWVLVPIRADFGTVTHELGHAFGLSHDFRDNTYVMSYGFIPDWLLANQRLSACNAEFLAVHPYFNSNSPIGEQSSPTIEERTASPIQTAGATSIPVRIRAQDPDGLHQAILFTQTQAPHYAEGFLEVKACRGLEGKRDRVVEFAYDGTVPSLIESDFSSFQTQRLRIEVIDDLGNVALSDRFELVNNEFREPLSTFSVSYPKFLSPVLYPPDGRVLALESYYKDAKVRLLDVSTGKSIANLPSWGRVETVALSPDGRVLALESSHNTLEESDNTIELWDVLSREHVASIPLPHEKDENVFFVVSSLSFSPDGRLLASGGRWDSLVKLWDASSGQHVATLPKDHGGTVRSIVFSLDGKLLASGSGGTIELWDVASREHVTTISARVDWGGLSLSPDGRLLASAGSRRVSRDVEEDTEVKLWDVASGQHIATLLGGAPVSFSPDGRLLASASYSKTRWIDLDGLEGGTSQGETAGGESVRLWDVATGKPIAFLPPWPRVERVGFSPDGRLLVEKSQNSVRLWDVSEWTDAQAITAVEQARPHRLTKVAGDGQEGLASTQLAQPFVVSVLDQNGAPFAGVVVRFSVTAGGGTLSATSATTDANGRARSTLTLGSKPGTNAVEATVAGLKPATFTAVGQAIPSTLTKVSGDGQKGPASTQLVQPLVVSVLDQNGAPLAGVLVRFSVTAGGGMLSSPTDANPCTVGAATASTKVTTDANGQAAIRLTLGREPGPNTVAATVAGLKQATFTATAAEPARPHKLTKVCGDNQEGPASTQLAQPLVVSVVDQNGAARAGVAVAFSVTAGEGTLSATTAITDANGRAACWLTLGLEPGTNAVEATVEGLEPVTFAATGQESLLSIFLSGQLGAQPNRTHLLQNAPNPFNSQTTLSYFLHTPGPVRLEVFALSGQRIAVLHQGPQSAGYHRLSWDGRDAAGHPVASGAYLYRLVTDEVVLTRKLILLQ